MLNRGIRRVKEFWLPIYGGLKPLAITDILKDCSALDLKYDSWDKDPGAGSFWDLTAIIATAKARSPDTCFEIGTGHGRTTLHLAINTAPSTKIYTLDISTAPVTGSIFRAHPENQKITQLVGDSKTFDFSKWIEKVDLVIVDGAHDYESVRIDTETAFRLVSPRGSVLWDDFDVAWTGVIKALRNSKNRGRIYRIIGTKLAYYSASPV